ncbi:dTDP-4-amino-4,6-dideoxygalactose transaminase [Sediminihabitans luteus]|uniref:dTDP-4-amino-4,6-dideoxygalactose transaminase n=1 Tax=Sediminihabitans luteus TaxID=1138585 RepID=A0A2M9D031_9CELL|nr:DegT/DnrJ/EryC1/StrS family aminotransferase [Sediminihabitans luteus]PJJ77358.1 dTDP-4-amino-4,6-dideoxygalactose transaminase [Sediminihabitans luteus]
MSMLIRTIEPIPSEAHSRRVAALRDDIHVALDRVVDEGRFHKGSQVRALERFVEDSWGGHAVAVSSGTVALQVALRAAGVGPGDEVVMPVTTFASTAFAAASIGAVPVLVDVDPLTRTLDPESVAAAVTDRTTAIVPVHMHGAPADLPELSVLAASHGIALVEDCAQAHGASIAGRRVGTFGDFGCFSLWVGKCAGGLADGGLVIARDPSATRRVRRLTDLGRDPEDRYVHHELGTRGRMDELTAAVTLLELDRLDAWRDRRDEIAQHYLSAFAGLPVGLPQVPVGARHAWYKFAIEVADAEAFIFAAGRRGVVCERVYPTTLAEQPALTGMPHRATSTPVADGLTRRLVCIPCYPELTSQEVDRVVEAVRVCAPALDAAALR